MLNINKQSGIQETSAEFISNTAILLNKIRLVAIVGITEGYVQQSGNWTLGWNIMD